MSERRITIGREPRTLHAVLDEPARAPRGGAVLCHPHPDYGGDMHNAVVVAASRAIAGSGRTALRFDFGHGVGRDEAAAIADTRIALDVLAASLPAGAPLALVGYSFGAWIACRTVAAGAPLVTRVVAIAPPLDLVDATTLVPLAVPVRIVVGDRDAYCSRGRVHALEEASAGLVRADIVHGADHFFADREDEVAALVLAALD
jgi:alpha/beta superfamily hydrolase